jgi:8-oxo-dGTP diphosphatase
MKMDNVNVYFEPSSTAAIKKTRKGASVNAYLIIRRDEDVLLLLRQNTGYGDGCWGLVAGHVEDGESATEGMVREAFEEAGIAIKPRHLKAVHVAHRRTDRLNVDIFFECPVWQGTPVNKEPEKCAALEYFSLHNLPSNTLEHISVALKAIDNGIFYSEFGWEKTAQ